MNKRYIVIALLMAQGLHLFATGQVPDILIYNEKEYDLTVNPMEPYFNKNPEKRPQAPHTALWRGYVATFEIIRNELWVTDIKKYSSEYINGRFTPGYVSIIKECLNGKDRMKVDWFNGLLILPQGELVEYVHMGYASTYEYYKLIELEKGNYLKEFTLSNEQYGKYIEAINEIYGETKTFDEIYRKLNDGTMPKEILDFFTKVFKQ